LAVVATIALLLSRMVAKSIAKPLQKLVLTMDEAEKGDLTIYVHAKYNDEVGQLLNKFNSMVGEINSLMISKQKDQLMLEQAQFNILAEQINPHFLYNTLESVTFLARQGEMESVISMVTAMTKLFKVVLNNGKMFLTVKQEFEYIENYLIIQKIRYQEKVTYDIDRPAEGISHCIVPKLILQPLVENAIYHGIKNRQQPGFISISARRSENDIVFLVKDTGIGIKQDKLDEINAVLKKKGGPEDAHENSAGLGLTNVNNRIKLLYGDKYGVFLESIYRGGTVARVVIPMRSAEETKLDDMGGMQ
jgi:two-component system sensor histidine kinase YesM